MPVKRRPISKRAPIASDRSRPKTTRPVAKERRPPEEAQSAAERMGRTLDAMPDRIDIRDWFYQPSLTPLPDILVNCDSVPAILDQGNEGACTGYALAAVVNFLLRARNVERSVSPRMLYEMARRYDEWPGENYEGSSARGAMKGWIAHGVVTARELANYQDGASPSDPGLVDRGAANAGRRLLPRHASSDSRYACGVE